MIELKNSMIVEYLPLKDIPEPLRRLRKPGKKQSIKTIRLIEACGWPIPVVLDSNKQVIIGQFLVDAARQMNMEDIPVIIAGHLGEEQVKVLRIAYSRLQEEEEWNFVELAKEFKDLESIDPDIDLSLTCFEIAEIDPILEADEPKVADEDICPDVDEVKIVSQSGDLFELGNHRILCGDSLQEESYAKLMGEQKAQMVFEDRPYNISVTKSVCGLGKIKHDEFAMATGEMSDEGFIDFNQNVNELLKKFSIQGAIIFSCMGWYSAYHVLQAARNSGLYLKNICVWVKTNAGMGAFFRSQHELVFVFKYGEDPHINNIRLGAFGRYRTNVWTFPGVNTFRKDRMKDLASHPTCKPVALVAEAIKGCSTRGGIILDPFGGSGTTLIACEKTGRKGRLIEIEPKFVDVTIRRWQELTGRKAIHVATGKTFNQIEQEGRNHD